MREWLRAVWAHLVPHRHVCRSVGVAWWQCGDRVWGCDLIPGGHLDRAERTEPV